MSQRGGGQLRSEGAGATSATVDGSECGEVRSGHLPGTPDGRNFLHAAGPGGAGYLRVRGPSRRNVSTPNLFEMPYNSRRGVSCR